MRLAPLFLLFFVGCGQNAVTYHKDIRPVMERKCVTCHTDGGITPFVLDSWEAVSGLTDLIAASVDKREMPPWGMDEDCRAVVGSIDLTASERDLFARWYEAGSAEGDLEDYVAPTPPIPFDPGPPDISLTLETGYLPPMDRVDDYRCMVIDQPFEEETFVAGALVSPDRLDLVHHIILYIAPPHTADALAELDAADEAPGFECFGDSGISESQMLTGWAPGGQMQSFDYDTAMRIPKGSLPILQLHYNRTTDAVPDDNHLDQSKVDLWTLPSGQTPETLLHLLPVVDLSLEIEAGDPHAVTVKNFYYPVDANIVGVAPHMHLLGSEIYTTVHHEDGQTSCITDINQWDFNWQRSYLFEQPVPLTLADRIELTCVYDNSEENQPVLNGAKQPSQAVSWGDGTFDEMCLNFLLVENPYYGAGEQGVCAGFQSCLDHCDPADAFCALACFGAAGESCMVCGIDGLFGNCLVNTCQTEAYALGSCYAACPRIFGEELGCMYSECAESFNAYYACIEPTLKDGSCASDFADCEGVNP
jgi:hypothetical protein